MGTQTLKLVTKSFLSWDYRVLVGEREIALIDRDAFRERAVFRLQGTPYEVRRTSVLMGTFELVQGRSVVAEARKLSAFSHRFEITAAGARYQLEKASLFSRNYRLLLGGEVVGEVQRDGYFARGATARLPDDLSLPLQLFVVVLVTTLWKRQAQAAS